MREELLFSESLTADTKGSTVFKTVEKNFEDKQIPLTNVIACATNGAPAMIGWDRRFVGIVVDWLKRRACDQHGLGSKPTRAILLCPWERHFIARSPAWWTWQAVLNYSHISIKL